MKRLLRDYLKLAVFAILALQVTSCKKDDPQPEVISGFTFEVDADNFKIIHFTNASANFSKSEWNFGDGSATSLEKDPVHTYAAAGTYTVTLTVTSSDGNKTDASEQQVIIADPNAALTALAGDISKTWKPLRQIAEVNPTHFPLLVGELSPSGVRLGMWWGFGRPGDSDLSERPCFLNDEFTFTRAGLAFNRDLKGDFYAGDGGIYNAPVEYSCQDVGAEGTTLNKDGADITAWRNMTGTFALTNGGTKLTINGLGAYLSLEKVATHTEVKVPQSSVTYDIAKLYDAPNGTDTLVVVVNYNFDDDAEMDAYWEFTLVHYDNIADEPAIPGPKPEAGFTATLTGNGLTTTNTSTNPAVGALTYSWDFGDGATSTAENPSHTYTDDGIYNVTVTATNIYGSTTSKAQMFVANANTPALTEALLIGTAWKVRADDNSLFVGPGFGKNDWYVVPKSDLVSGDWDCLSNDEFTFSASSVYGYDTKGDVRNDGYMAGFDNGCLTDAQLATVTNDGAKFKTEANHSFAFTAASGLTRAKITVTNGGANGAVAFLGFYKPYNGGENSNQATPAHNGATSVTYEVMGYAKSATKEYLFVSVDYSPGQDGSQAWSFVLVR